MRLSSWARDTGLHKPLKTRAISRYIPINPAESRVGGVGGATHKTRTLCLKPACFCHFVIRVDNMWKKQVKIPGKPAVFHDAKGDAEPLPARI